MANPTADFPTSLHSATDISANTASALGGTSPTHTEVEGKQEAEITAIQTKIGTGASTPDTGKVLYSTGAGVSTWSDLNTLVDAISNVASVNGQTGTVVLDADDIDDTATTNKFVTAADITKLGNLSGTNTGDQDLSSYLQNIVEDTTPQLGGNLDANGNNLINQGDITFKTGAAGGTLRTGTSNADKFTLQAYDVNGGAYVTLMEADAGNDPYMQVFTDYFRFEDASDATKIAKFDVSGITTGTTRTFTFPDATGTLALTSDLDAKVDVAGDTMTGTLTVERLNSTQSSPIIKINSTDTGSGAQATLVMYTNNVLRGYFRADGSGNLGFNSSGTGGIDFNYQGGTGNVNFYQGTGLKIRFTPSTSVLLLNGSAPAITTGGNNNLSLIPSGTGYTIIGDAGTTSHTFNTNDDLFVSGRLEVDGVAYFDGTSEFTGAVSFTGTTTHQAITVSRSAPQILFTDTGETTPEGKFLLEADSATFRIRGRNALDTGWESLHTMSRLANSTVHHTFEGATVFNEGGGAYDFRVETDTDTHAFYVDGTNNRIGIGTSAPQRKLHIRGEDAIRVDRGSDSPGMYFVRYEDSTYATVWKSFLFAMSASSSNNGSFFISDTGTGTSGAGTKRLEISNSGDFGITGVLTSITANGNLSLVPNGTGYTLIGNAGSTSHTFNTNDDLFVSGRLEVDGVSYFDNHMYFTTATTGSDGANAIILVENTIEAFQLRPFYGMDQLVMALGAQVGGQLVITKYDNRNKDHDHAEQGNPTLYIHSVTDPDTANDEWISFTHDQTDGIIDTGSGSIKHNVSAKFNKEAVFSGEVDNGNSSTADTVDWTAGNKQKSTLTDNCTFTFTAPSGPCSLTLKLVQDGVGSHTVTWPATVKWAGGTAPTLSTGAAAIDIVSFYYDGTNYYGAANLNFS